MARRKPGRPRLRGRRKAKIVVSAASHSIAERLKTVVDRIEVELRRLENL